MTVCALPSSDLQMSPTLNFAADASMAARYRERIDDDRLQAVVDHVRMWALGKKAKPGKKAGSKPKPASKRAAKKAAEKIPQESFRIVG